MMKSDASFTSLVAHPSTPCEAVRAVAASVDVAGPMSLRFMYVLEGDLKRVRIPPLGGDAGRTDKLWTHTCFEAFVGLAESPQYLELNFSPAGEWAAYCFQSYRKGMTPALDSAPRLTLGPDAHRYMLQAEVRLSGALDFPASAEPLLRIALSAVVEDREGRLSYWALGHPSGRPDFHHPDSFSVALALSRNPAQ